MYTSSKLRKLRRIQRLKRQRHIAIMFILIIGLTIINSIFWGIGMHKSVAQDGISVTVVSGDTLWSIAAENKPYGKDLREFIYEISKINSIDDGMLTVGQTITVPKI